MIIRQAVADDLDHIIRWRQHAAIWLATQGSDQWSDVGLSDQAFVDRVRASIEAGETWMADQHGSPVGTIAIDQWSDDGLWTTEEMADAVFVHRMIIDRSVSGQGIGKALLEQADQVATQAGKHWVRLDAWTTNANLHRYYEAAGFQHVRTVNDHPSPSAALFERAVHPSDTPQDDLAGEGSVVRKTP